MLLLFCLPMSPQVVFVPDDASAIASEVASLSSSCAACIAQLSGSSAALFVTAGRFVSATAM
jgi:hypothetical protein